MIEYINETKLVFIFRDMVLFLLIQMMLAHWW